MVKQTSRSKRNGKLESEGKRTRGKVKSGSGFRASSPTKDGKDAMSKKRSKKMRSLLVLIIWSPPRALDAPILRKLLKPL